MTDSDNEIFKNNLKQKISEVEKSMKEIMPNVPPESVYSLCWDFLERGGKRVRPYLMLTMIEAFNKDYKNGLEIASGIEIFHNFTLIHDDIEDGSELRRGKPLAYIYAQYSVSNKCRRWYVCICSKSYFHIPKLSCEEKEKSYEILTHGLYKFKWTRL